jgi:hypothetical protein
MPFVTETWRSTKEGLAGERAEGAAPAKTREPAGSSNRRPTRRRR